VLLTVDIGNTNITLGTYDKDDSLVFVARFATDKSRTCDQYAIELSDIFKLYNKNINDVDGAVICSVVPSLTDTLSKALILASKIEALIVGPGIKTGLNILIDNPAQLGADIVAGAVAAISKYPLPCAVFDMGTATTLSVIDSKANFLGVTIMPGVIVSMDALSARSAQLPQVDFSAPESVIGKNTIDSMKAGLVYGNAAMLDGIIDRVSNELSAKPTVIATGGLSKDIIPHCIHEIVFNDTLILDGLMIMYKKNKTK